MAIERDQLRKLMIFAALALIVGLALGVPYYRRAGALRREARELGRLVRADQQTMQELILASAQVQKLRNQTKDFSTQVPTRPDVGGLLEQLSADLKAQQVSEPEIQANSVIEGGELSRIPVLLQFRGSFASLYGFIDRMESYRRLVCVDRMEVTGDPRRAGDPLSVRLELSVYYRSSPDEEREPRS